MKDSLPLPINILSDQYSPFPITHRRMEGGTREQSACTHLLGFLSAGKLGIPYTSYYCVSHPPNDKLKLMNPGEHHIALSLLWPHGSPNPLNVQPSWLSGVTAFMPTQ